jgi:hypothetical protein
VRYNPYLVHRRREYVEMGSSQLARQKIGDFYLDAVLPALAARLASCGIF